jgi:hypothetical protein
MTTYLSVELNQLPLNWEVLGDYCWVMDLGPVDNLLDRQRFILWHVEMFDL